MQENRRNGREESDIVAICEPYTSLRKKQRLYQFFVDSVSS